MKISTVIRLQDTDATGVLYFSQQFSLVLEAFVHFLKASGLSLQTLIEENSFLLPIVHASGDYLIPLFVGDAIEIFPYLSRLGNSSFTLHYILKRGEEVAGRVSIVHVTVSQETRKSTPLPQKLIELLSSLPPAEKAASGSV